MVVAMAGGTVAETGMARLAVVQETATARVTGILMAVDAAVATVTPAATETPEAGTAAARLAAEETATVRATATLTAADVVVGLAIVAGTETVVEMPEAKAAEVAMSAIRGMLAATVAAMRARAAVTETVVGTAMVRPAVAQEMATAAAKATQTLVVWVAA
jgi:hypothetical protein